MARVTQRQVIDVLLDRHGRTYAAEAGIRLGRGTPAPLFRLLCLSILLSARIRADAAVAAARALADRGWTTPSKMAASTWAQRTRTLNRAGYARYDESTSRMLGETTGLLLDQYGGDLRQLRHAGHSDPATERQLLKAFKGIGDVGVDIFFREIQLAWDELYPFAGKRDLDAAAKLGLEKDPAGLARHVSREDFPRLTAALIRAGIARDFEAVREQAQAG